MKEVYSTVTQQITLFPLAEFKFETELIYYLFTELPIYAI